jgi:hypothetical protein
MFGIAGWTKNDEAVLLNDTRRLAVAVDGSGARVTSCGWRRTRLGAVCSRSSRSRANHYDQLAGVDVQPASKKSGYGRVPAGGSTMPGKILWMDKSVTGLALAERPTCTALRQDADDSPDIFVGVDRRCKADHEYNAFMSNTPDARRTRRLRRRARQAEDPLQGIPSGGLSARQSI